MEPVTYEELLQKHGRIITHAVGGSMLPLLHDRQSIVILEAVQKVRPKKGDVVLYKTDGVYILHRIQEITEEEYLVRGDNTRMIEHVPRSAVLATLTGFYRAPNGKLITRTNTAYLVYRAALPAIRRIRRAGGKIRGAARHQANHENRRID